MKRKVLSFLAAALVSLIFSLSLSAQTMKTVRGTVSDPQEPLIGASVTVKGHQGLGVTTDVDGNYTLKAPVGCTLVFSYIGYDPQEITFTGQSTIDITLVESATALEEVVVVAYGEQKKIALTGAVSSVNGDDLLRSPTASLGNSITGRLSGVSSVQTSGAPGGDDPDIYVRGIGSFNNASPLVLVDGVERSFTQIDPNEVENISVLKDASATAVFGVRGANGVILITTKRGSVGETRISASASYSIHQVSDFIEMSDSYTWASLYNNAQRTDGTAEGQLRFSPEALAHFKNGDSPYLYPNTNWLEYVMKDTAPQQQYNVSVSGGSDKVKYFVSLGILSQDGLFKSFSDNPHENFSYNRYNYRANVDLTLDKNNELSVNLGGRMQDRYTLAVGESDVFAGLIDATPFSGYGIDAEGRRITANKSYVGDFNSDGLASFYGRGYNNQVTNVVNLDLLYKLKMDWLTKGLYFKMKVSYNSEYTQQKLRTIYSGVSYEPVETETGAIAFRKSGDAWNLGYDETYSFARDWYAEASLNYSRRFGLHEFTALALYNQSKYYYPAEYTDIPHGYVGLVGRFTYNFDNRYLAEFNVGYNGSENFAKGYRYGFFPSLSLGWIASGEKFWEPVSTLIPYLKFRGSIGKVGNDNMNNARFLYLPGTYIINRASGYNFGLSTWTGSASEESAGNPFVTWETATKQNYGIDMRWFMSRLAISADIFFEDRKDILINNENFLPGILAQKPSSVNYGRVKNHGYELNVKWNDHVGKDFRYSLDLGFAFARNKVIENGEVKPQYDNLSLKGYPVGQRTGYEFVGFYNPGVTENLYKEMYGVEMPKQMIPLTAGDCVYADITGDGIVDENDIRAMYYSDVPEITYNANVFLSYKNFDFSMLWVGVGNVTRNLQGIYRAQYGSMNRSGLMQWVADNSWTPETADSAILPRLSFTAKANNTVNSSVYYADASYIRLKNVELGYTWRKPLKFINDLRFYVSGYNLLTFCKFKANDPESATASINYPLTRIYNIGVSINF